MGWDVPLNVPIFMIFDCFTFFNELDLLELRLSILDKYVDRFIIVESYETFTGLPKPLVYAENKERFAKWNDKIIHIVAPNIEIKEVAFERHWLCYELIEQELLKYNDEDIAFCSDLDEIWNPDILTKIDDQIHSLAQFNYSYYLNMRSSEQWVGTIASKIKNIFVGYNKWGRTAKPNILPNGGWHLTNMGGVEQLIKKVQAYDHGPEINQEWFKANIEGLIENGRDYLARDFDYEGKPFKFWLEEENWPEYLKNNKEKYQHLCK